MTSDPALEAAVSRGSAVAERLISFRDRLFEPLAGILLIAGPEGLRACAAGVVEAVIIAAQRRQERGGEG